MNVARGIKEVKQAYVANNIPTDLYREWKEVKDEMGRTAKSLMMESMIDVIEKYRGEVRFDGYTKYDGAVRGLQMKSVYQQEIDLIDEGIELLMQQVHPS